MILISQLIKALTKSQLYERQGQWTRTQMRGEAWTLSFAPVPLHLTPTVRAPPRCADSPAIKS